MVLGGTCDPELTSKGIPSPGLTIAKDSQASQASLTTVSPGTLGNQGRRAAMQRLAILPQRRDDLPEGEEESRGGQETTGSLQQVSEPVFSPFGALDGFLRCLPPVLERILMESKISIVQI